ncbi:glycosyltransferase family 4 protein [Loktanella sp. TSTF-M6]|uniref:Glycosyltransferase family 4 protein n=1 Tax=Loktanella gaetbuli TaxID=2881335 RepID=A0ABS8BUD6_9RHOB|nr:glycosyltransferase family 1 protein [Loktanella gaetbuli]MCB5199267.1 glycosyltransferase family 4 protein [Loktanella gaetbuli]
MTRTRLLDISRLVSRAGLTPTGVDRVELAYVDAFLADTQTPVYGLARTALGLALLDRKGLTAFATACRTGSFDLPDILSRLNGNLTPAARRGQSFVRWRAVDRCRPHRLGRMLDRLGSGLSYYNVGHSNLTGQLLRTLSNHDGSRVTVLIHDTIPLDHPDMQRPKSVPRFRKMLTAALNHADQLICTTQAAANDLRRHAGPRAGQLDVVVAPLGVTPPRPAPEEIPYRLSPVRPYFMVVGTIEPRKNHALLLDIWQDWGPGAPDLLICGRRGWLNEDVFRRLDEGVPHVKEAHDLSDGAIAALLAGSQGLLFPSFAEGYGLPPIEAAALGVPVICADLAACREAMGDWPVYLNPSDRYEWSIEIRTLLDHAPARRTSRRDAPSWKQHFDTVLTSAP